MSSTEEQSEIEQASNSVVSTQQDVGEVALSNCLRLLNLESIRRQVNPQWDEGEYDPEIKYSGNGYIILHLSDYVTQNFTDNQISYQFIEDFSEWEEDDWKAVTKQIRDRVRQILRKRGCYVPINNLTVAKNLFNTVQELVEEWPQEAIIQQIQRYGGFNPRSRYSRVQPDNTVVQQPSPRTAGTTTTRFLIALPLRGSNIVQ